MAGDWIKMRTDLAEDPAVIGVAEILGIHEDLVVGKLHKFWSWANRQTTDGNADGVTYSWLDRYLDCSGFCEALEEHGWLMHDGATVSIPNFDRHNGQSAKARALTSKRVSNYRSVTKALPEKRREEKRREIIPPKSPKGENAYSPCFERWWGQYPEGHRTGKQVAYRSYKKTGGILVARGMSKEQAVEFLLAKVTEFANSPKGRSEYVPYPATWLNQGRYDDAPEAWNRVDAAGNGQPKRTMEDLLAELPGDQE
jgi:hypothetical protein